MRRTRSVKKAAVYAGSSSSEDEDEPKKKSPCIESSDSNDAFVTSAPKKTTNSNDQKKRISLQLSDREEETKSPDRKRVTRVQPSDDEEETKSPDGKPVTCVQPSDDEEETKSPDGKPVTHLQPSDDEEETKSPDRNRVTSVQPSDDEEEETKSPDRKRVSRVQSSDDEETISPGRRKVARLQPSDDDETKADSSSSESDIETYLKRPDELNLNSMFFKTDQTRVPFSQIENNIFKDVKQLSDSEPDLEEEEEVEVEGKKKAAVVKTANEAPKATFEQLTEFTKRIEEAKLHVEKYEARKKFEEKKVDISKLLTMGEKTAWDSPEMLKGVNSALVKKSTDSSEFESFSESEKDDWEEVEQTEKPPKSDVIPKDGVEITLRMPDTIRKKKGVDLLAAMKRRLNRFKKENQLYVHRVHLLCWIAHGNYVNDVLNSESVLALALSLLPSQHSYPSDRMDLKYLEQILTWYRKTVTNVERNTPKDVPLDKNLMMQINRKQTHNLKMYVYIFICILRALGIQCRLVLSLQVEPLRPSSGDLHSLSKKEDGDNKASSSGLQNVKDASKKSSVSHSTRKPSSNKKNQVQKNARSKKKDEKNVTLEEEVINNQKPEIKRRKVGERESIASKKSKVKSNETIKDKREPGKSSNPKGEQDLDPDEARGNKRSRQKVSSAQDKIKSKSADRSVDKLDIEEIRKIIGVSQKTVDPESKSNAEKKSKTDTRKSSRKKDVTNLKNVDDVTGTLKTNDAEDAKITNNVGRRKSARNKNIENDENIQDINKKSTANSKTATQIKKLGKGHALNCNDDEVESKLKDERNERNKNINQANNDEQQASSSSINDEVETKKNIPTDQSDDVVGNKKLKVNVMRINLSTERNKNVKANSDGQQTLEVEAASQKAVSKDERDDQKSSAKTKKRPSLSTQKTSNRKENNEQEKLKSNSDDVEDDIDSIKPVKSARLSDVANGSAELNPANDQSKPVSKKSRSRKSVSKVERTLDDYVATLEDLEKVDVERGDPADNTDISKTSTNPTSSKTKLQVPSMFDDIEMDRDRWRRSKSHSPYGQKTERTPALETSVSSSKLDETTEAVETAEKVKKGHGKRIQHPRVFRMPLKRKAKSSEIPQMDGINDSSDETSDDAMSEILQVDGNDDGPSTSKKPSLNKLKEQNPSAKKHPTRLKIQPIYNEVDSEDDFCPRKSKINLSKLKDPESPQKSPTKVNLQRLGQSPKKPLDIRSDIVGLIKGRIREQKHKDRSKLVKKLVDNDSDSDYAPMPVFKKVLSSEKKVPVKRRVKPKSELNRKVFSSDEEGASNAIKKKKGVDIWIEVYLENEEKWISADVVKGQVHCIKEIYSRASHPVSYILAWDNTNRVKDITKRYCLNWNTVTRKLRTDQKWWEQSLAPFVGKKNARDKEEDEDLARQQLDQPLPKVISEFKDHPLYVLQRHLLKFQAIYPPDAITLGFVRKEPVYSRDCVYTLHSREIWLKHAKVVKPGEKPYKIVKARPKYVRSSNTFIKDQLLEIFGPWQIEDYVPPTAENGVIPRNAYGNVELFKECMIPKGTVHLQLPGLNKVAKKLNIDCAPAVTGFDFHSGWSHPTFDGFIVCEEFVDKLVAAWYEEQEEIEKRQQEKYEKRVYGNWRRLIKGLFIRERLKARYDFAGELTVPIPKPPEKPETKPKGPRFIVNKKKKK